MWNINFPGWHLSHYGLFLFVCIQVFVTPHSLKHTQHGTSTPTTPCTKLLSHHSLRMGFCWFSIPQTPFNFFISTELSFRNCIFFVSGSFSVKHCDWLFFLFSPVNDFAKQWTISQIEGAYLADGKGLNNWDVFTHKPGSHFLLIIF